jgi:DNA repair protein RecO (recombination protein O)
MIRTYKATGINLKSAPIGESDRVLTVLTREFGLIRAVAPGVHKQRSTIGGRSELFVVNELLIAKGRSLDKITQAETVQSHPGLSRNLGKLASAQYLAELALSLIHI